MSHVSQKLRAMFLDPASKTAWHIIAFLWWLHGSGTFGDSVDWVPFGDSTVWRLVLRRSEPVVGLKFTFSFPPFEFRCIKNRWVLSSTKSLNSLADAIKDSPATDNDSGK